MFESLQSEITMETRDFSRSTDRAENDLSGLQQQADRTASKFESVGGRLKDIGSTLTLGVTLPLAAVGAKSIQTAADVEEMQNRLSVTFGESTEDIVAWSESVADETNRSALLFQRMAGDIGTTLSGIGFEDDQVETFSKQLSVMAADLSSFHNIDTQDAMDRLRSGLVGNFESLDQFGIALTAGMVKQEAYRKGIAETGAELTEQQKVLARLSLIQRSMGEAQGDAARTADSFSNRLKGLKGSLREVGVAIGQQLMPMAADIVGVIRGATDAFTGLDENIQRLVVGLGVAAAAVGPVLFGLGALATVVGTVGLPVVAAAAAVAGLGAALFAFKDDLGGATDTLASFRDMVAGAIARVRAAVDRHAGDIAESFSKIGAAIKGVIESRAFATFADGILGILTTVVDGFLTTVNIIGKLLTGDLTGALSESAGFYKRTFRGLLEFIDKWTDGFVSTFVNGIIRGINRGADAIEGFVRKIPGFGDFSLGSIETVDFGTAAASRSFGAMSDPGGAPERGSTPTTGQGSGGTLPGGLGGTGAAGVGTAGGGSSLTAEDLHALARERSGELRPSDVGLSAEEFSRILNGEGPASGSSSSQSARAVSSASSTMQSAATTLLEAARQLADAEITVDQQGFIRFVDGRVESHERRKTDRYKRSMGVARGGQ